ncbi:MAG: hypothetical protein K8R99_01905 [Actinomycetia bacterium]|nr:hypothetical protein [Actinomycetes bacterium]
MKPHPTPEQALASAYLDGDVTAAERARVDGSPELLALVASMRHAVSLIAAVTPPPDAGREAALAAALAEFDTRTNGNLNSTSNVISLDSHRRWPAAVLTAAAAVVLVGVVGISVLRDTSDHKSESAALATDDEATKRSDTGVADGAVAGAQPTGGADEVILQSSVATLEIDDPQDLLTLAPPAPYADTAPVADTTGIAAETATSAERLDSYNVDALACMTDTQVFLADISYRGMLAIAVRDTVTGVTEAIDSNCRVLARVNS